MKIAVNTRLLLPHKLEGIGWFTYEIFKRLTRQHPEVEWLFIFDRPQHRDFIFADNVTPVVAGPPARHPLLWYLWFEWSLPRVFHKHRPDLFISPDGYLSLRSKVKSLTVIHDINFEHHPGYIPALTGKYLRHFFPRFAHRAQRIATVSQFSRQDISETYGVNSQKIDLVYNGCGDFFTPLSPDQVKLVRAEITGGKPYFLFIGALNPRKNITGMLHAFARYRKKVAKIPL
ncbi:MAG: glycosyltransferase [Owenweeksia sp.]|nr:glycosyltransferase [Owenweeksia sp.]